MRLRRAIISLMSSPELVNGLYRLVLGRDADADGLAHWLAQEPGEVLTGLLASEEYAARSDSPRSDIPKEARERLGRRPRVVDVGAHPLNGVHAYSPLEELGPIDVVGFDPLEDRLRERAELDRARGGSLTLLPYAVGDGSIHTLYVNNEDATTSLFPLNVEHNAAFSHLHTLHTIRTAAVQTHRLDDVLPPGPVDFLKIDVQGAELMVLQSGREVARRSAVVHCEVEFAPIYSGQPLFSEVNYEMSLLGFDLIDLIKPSPLYHMVGTAQTTPDVMLWADAVYFRRSDDPETRIAQALVAAAVYAKLSLAESLLAAAVADR